MEDQIKKIVPNNKLLIKFDYKFSIDSVKF